MTEIRKLEDRIQSLQKELAESQKELAACQQQSPLPLRLEKSDADGCCAKLAKNEHANTLRRDFMKKSSYEVRTSLNSVLSALDVLEEYSTEISREYVDMAMSEAIRLYGIIRNVFDFYRLETSDVELQSIDFDLKHNLDSDLYALSFDAHSRDIEFSCDIAPEVPKRLRGDGRRLSQIIAGLVGNRLRHTHDEGAVAVNVTTDGFVNDGRILIRFAVTDTGNPLSQDFVKEVRRFVQQEVVPGRFEPLVAGDAALDLVCSLQILKIFNANIAISSTDGGNLFCFSLPFEISGKYQEKEPVQLEEPFSILRGKKILVVEDDFINRVLVTKLLEQQAVTVVTAEDGQKGIDKLSKEHFDLVLMDLQMPVLDGLEATRRIRLKERGKGKRTKIIALTALADREKCLQVGMDDYLAKPLDKKVFVDTLTEHLTKSALVVHDDMETVQNIMSSLVGKGWRVTTAETSRQALYEAALGRFDAYFMDSSLPPFKGIAVPDLVKQLDDYVDRHSVVIGLGEPKENAQYFDTIITPPCTSLVVDEQLALLFKGDKSSN